jgi:thiamine-phosphate pyrophosphorylase
MAFRFPSRLYAILDVECARSAGHGPMDLLDLWLGAGVRLLQLRAKTLASGELLSLAEQMAARCRSAGATFIVNDRVDVACLSGADGVHVGQDDLPAAAARRLAGDAAIIGLSTHTDMQLGEACGAPVSYVAIGPTFSTSTKSSSNADVGLAGVSRAAAQIHAAGLPIVAIGGITLSTAPGVVAAGADAVAVIADLLVGDPGKRARQYLAALS